MRVMRKFEVLYLAFLVLAGAEMNGCMCVSYTGRSAYAGGNGKEHIILFILD